MKTNIQCSIDVDIARKAKQRIPNLSAFVENKLREVTENGKPN